MVWAKSILGRENTKHNGQETGAKCDVSEEQKEGQYTCGIMSKVRDVVGKTSAGSHMELLAWYQR